METSNPRQYALELRGQSIHKVKKLVEKMDRDSERLTLLLCDLESADVAISQSNRAILKILRILANKHAWMVKNIDTEIDNYIEQVKGQS